MNLESFRVTRFQFRRDRTIGDSQVWADDVNVAALELIASDGTSGLGFLQSLFSPLPEQEEIERLFRSEHWPKLEGRPAQALAQQIERPRGGNLRPSTLPFREAIQVAAWDLAAKQAGLPLWKMLGASRDRVPAYASGLDFHLDDSAFCELFGTADASGYGAFKMKVGHHEFERDLHRLALLSSTVRKGARIMIDANEAWSPKEALMKLETIRAAGFELLWVEDPVLRFDFDGLRRLRNALPWTQVNSGEYLDVSGKRNLLMADATDMLNVHGHVTDVMRIGWLAAEMGVPVTMGNTFLETGVHAAAALPGVEWLEYSFQNLDHLVEEPIEIRDGFAIAPDRPGHGLVLSETARRNAEPKLKAKDSLGPPPRNAHARGLDAVVPV
jgi:L-alanine-DL-glutamate epimerase-like enolase superfamily enzyme